MSVNKVILLGRVGVDPEVKYMPSGNAVLNLSLATSRKFKNQESGAYEDKTEWHRVVFFNKPAETIGQYVKKGQQLYVEGRLHLSLIQLVKHNMTINRKKVMILIKAFHLIKMMMSHSRVDAGK